MSGCMGIWHVAELRANDTRTHAAPYRAYIESLDVQRGEQMGLLRTLVCLDPPILPGLPEVQGLVYPNPAPRYEARSDSLKPHCEKQMSGHLYDSQDVRIWFDLKVSQ